MDYFGVSVLYPGDSYLDGGKVGDYGTPEKWFKSLNRFFSMIERYKKIDQSCSTPKVKHKVVSVLYMESS